MECFEGFYSMLQTKYTVPSLNKPSTGLCGGRSLADLLPPFPKSPINICLPGKSRLTPAQNQEKKLRNKILNHIQHFSQFTPYAITIIIKVTYVQVRLESSRQASALEKVK